MSSSEKRAEELLDKLVLDVKAFVLLQGSEAELKAKLKRKLGGSQDDSISRFVEALQESRADGRACEPEPAEPPTLWPQRAAIP